MSLGGFGAANRDAEELRVAQPRAAPLTVDRERRREGGCALAAAAKELAAAFRALAGKLQLELLEPAPRPAAAQADRRPVAQHLPPFLTQPVGGLAHVAGR